MTYKCDCGKYVPKKVVMDISEKQAETTIFEWCKRVRDNDFSPVMRIRPQSIIDRGTRMYAVLDASCSSFPIIAEGDTWMDIYRILQGMCDIWKEVGYEVCD